MRVALMIALALLAAVPARAPAQERTDLKLVATVEHGPLHKIGGLAWSDTYNVCWAHGTTKRTPRLFAFDTRGRIAVPKDLKPEYATGLSAPDDKELWPGLELLNAARVDWSDLALHDGKLYVADLGNPQNARRDLGVYVLDEPNPYAIARARCVRFLPVRYPEQERFPPREWRYDCGAMFVARGKLHFLTRRRDPAGFEKELPGTKLYRLDTAHTDEVNVLTPLGEQAKMKPPTAADLSPNGMLLAVLTTHALWIFGHPKDFKAWFETNPRRLLLPRERLLTAEALCWETNDHLRIVNHEGEVYRVAAADVRPFGGR